MYRTLSAIICALLLSAATARAQNISVGDVMKLPIPAGEGQSTVVPPNMKGQCKAGRILVSNDGLRPPNGVVSGRDLDKKEPTVVSSIFDMGTLGRSFDADYAKSSYIFATNDHDLVTLSNGDVLYVTGAFSRMPPFELRGLDSQSTEAAKQANPVWWKDTYRSICLAQDSSGNCRKVYPWGPGARSVVLVWRSTDCGEHFEFVSEFDPARFGGGLCAMPQFRLDAKQNVIPDKTYEAGGTDGSLVKVDPATDRVYMTFGCVGSHRLPGKSSEFLLDSNNPIYQTLIAAADNEGETWRALGYIKERWWRVGIAPLPGGELGFGFNNAVVFGRKDAAGRYEFDSTAVQAPEASLGLAWEGTFPANSNIPIGSIHANVWASSVITRTPDATGSILAYPAALGNQGYGYHLYFYDQLNKKLGKANDIFPATPSKDNFIFHLTAIDPGKGPILLYWYDFDSATKKATIRGRLITSDSEYSDDFLVSQSAGKPHTINLTSQDYWFGDYHSGGGFVTEGAQSMGQGKSRVLIGEGRAYDYYPMWVEPDGTVRYTKVEYVVHVDQSTIFGSVNKPKPIKLNPLTQKQWRPQPPPVTFSELRRSMAPREMTREDDVRRH
jgi:hypothetical protein